MSTLLMVRHGESTANLALRYTWHDDEPLTELGHRQARETGRRLAAEYRPAHLYCSRFHRARQTAEGIAAEVGLPVVEIDDIQERYFGELRGKPWADYRQVVAPLEMEELWHHRAPGGESLVDVAARVAPVVSGLADRHLGQQVIVVSHGGVMAALRAWLAGTWNNRPTPTKNADGFRLERDGAGWRPPEPLFDAH